ncbi:MAG: AAA family ATPase [Gammaproteobacteria bacterium]|nr:AAA family ATPase [Gammaproteobacteria bacterium]
MDIDFDSVPLTAADSFLVEARDPFSDQVVEDRYFLDENRKLSLNKLIHLAPHYRLIAVEGPAGVGKSCLLAQLVARTSENWRVGVIRCHSLTGADEFLRDLATQIGVRVNSKWSRQETLEELGFYMQQLGRSGRRAIIVLENADLLGEEVIALLQALLRDERSQIGLDLILSGVTESLAKLLAVLPQPAEYTVRIDPLDERATADYVRHRLTIADADYELGAFSDSVLRRIYKRSQGIPAQINQQAREVLAKSRGGSRRFATNLPWRWLGISVLITGAGAVLIWQNKINQLFTPSAQPTATVSQEVAAVQPLPVPQLKGDIRREEAESTPAEPVAEVTAPAAKPVIDAPVASTATTKPAPMVETKPKTEFAPAAAVAATKAAPVAPAPAAEAPTKPKLEVAANGKPDQAWLQAQGGNHYTLQLMAMEDAAKVQNFIKERRIEKDSATFQVKRNGKLLTVLVYGSYPSQEQAQKAATTVMQDWGLNKPWIRNFDSVRQAAK